MFSHCLEPFVDVSAPPLDLLEQSRDVAAPLLQRGTWTGKEIQQGRFGGEGKDGWGEGLRVVPAALLGLWRLQDLTGVSRMLVG